MSSVEGKRARFTVWRSESLFAMVIDELSEFIAAERKLPPEVSVKAKQHILDTVAAMASGSKLKPGRLAINHARSQRGRREATVVGTKLVVPAVLAALANGMLAHADETDDTHSESRTHPGCAIIPAALATAEKENESGLAFLHSVVIGYDVGCRLTRALGRTNWGFHSTYSLGGTFGAAAAASRLCRFDARQIRSALSYAAQQASGVLSWVRDPDHVEKAFDFGGMPARNGVTAAAFVQSGFTGVEDILEGEKNFLDAYSPAPKPEELVDGLGSRYEIMVTSIKRFPVGAPIQAAADAALLILNGNSIAPENISSVTVTLPADGAAVVNERHMPDINLQYIMAVLLLDRQLSFESAHSLERMNDRTVLDMKARVHLVADEDLMRAAIPRQGIVEIAMDNGQTFRQHVQSVRGTPQNPMTNEEVEEKALDLLVPVLGNKRSQRIIKGLRELETLASVRELAVLLRRS